MTISQKIIMAVIAIASYTIGLIVGLSTTPRWWSRPGACVEGHEADAR